jgi:hypothetical protein
MARKDYSEEFRRQAVDLYESTPGATLRGITADLGVSRGTLADWVMRSGPGRRPPRSLPHDRPVSPTRCRARIAGGEDCPAGSPGYRSVLSAPVTSTHTSASPTHTNVTRTPEKKTADQTTRR